MEGGKRDAEELPAGTPQDLEAELARVRQRERHYRCLLEEAQRHGEASHRLSDTLVRLSVSPIASREGGRRALEELVRTAQSALGVARVGLWLADRDLSAIECELLVRDGTVTRRPGLRIARSSSPHYFAAVLSGRGLPMADVRTHPATVELGAYVTEHDVRSMLDVPVRIAGETVGILCHEQVGAPRVWTDGEQAFAASVADLCALAIEHERVERARRGAAETTARYQHLVESLPVVVYSFDAHGALDYVSPSIEGLTGAPPDHWLGQAGAERWLERVHPDDRDAVRRRLERGPSDAGRAIEYRVRDGEGAERWVRDTYTVVRAAEGAPLGVQGILDEVTERVLADRARAEWERRFRSMLATVELIAVMVDEDGRVTYVNEYFLELMGLAEADVLGADWRALVSGRSQEVAAPRGPRLAEGRSTTAQARADETRLRSASGQTHLIRWSHTVLRAHDRRVVGTASLGVDLTAREELELRGRRDAAEETLGRLAAGVAHDLANALAGLGLTVEVLRGAGATDAGVRREALATLEACTERATELTRGLLDVARERPSDPEELDVDASISASAPLLRALTSERPIVLDIRPSSEPTAVFADPGQLQRVLLNLVANARDASSEGGHIVVRTERVFLDAAEGLHLGLASGPYCVIEVEDSGHGIPLEALPHVFEPYFTTKGPTQGTGLGLAASRAMIRRAGGEIDVESQVGRGTRFRVYLPVRREEHAAG